MVLEREYSLQATDSAKVEIPDHGADRRSMRKLVDGVRQLELSLWQLTLAEAAKNTAETSNL